jgi:hypothetical protein
VPYFRVRLLEERGGSFESLLVHSRERLPLGKGTVDAANEGIGPANVQRDTIRFLVTDGVDEVICNISNHVLSAFGEKVGMAAASAMAGYRSVQSYPRRVNRRTVGPSRRTIRR